jgi:hypothetical protein
MLPRAVNETITMPGFEGFSIKKRLVQRPGATALFALTTPGGDTDVWRLKVVE